MTTIIFTATEVSGLANPTYPSASARKKYVDDISGNCRSRFPASSTAISRYYPSTMGHSDYLHSSNANKHLTSLITTPLSGQVLTYMQNNARWENKYPSMTYNVANVLISANSNLNVARFDTGTDKNCYLWQANCCGSGGIGISGLKVQLLSGTTNKYLTSSQIIQQGNPLTKTGGKIEIRMMYSGGAILTGRKFGTSFMNVSVY